MLSFKTQLAGPLLRGLLGQRPSYTYLHHTGIGFPKPPENSHCEILTFRQLHWKTLVVSLVLLSSLSHDTLSHIVRPLVCCSSSAVCCVPAAVALCVFVRQLSSSLTLSVPLCTAAANSLAPTAHFVSITFTHCSGSHITQGVHMGTSQHTGLLSPFSITYYVFTKTICSKSSLLKSPPPKN